eukprot:6789445-Prorocentrum_lima.AAC.1
MEGDWDVMDSDGEGAWGIPADELELAGARQARPPSGLDERIPLPFQTRWGPYCSPHARFFHPAHVHAGKACLQHGAVPDIQ